MKKFLGILVAAMLTTTVWAELITLDGIQYQVDPQGRSYHVTIPSNQCFAVDDSLIIPEMFDYVHLPDIYPIDLSNTNFFANDCNEHILVLKLDSGHTMLAHQSGHSNLECFDLPSTMQRIDNLDVSNCLVKVICRATTPPTLAQDVSAQLRYRVNLYVPQSALQAYRNHAKWGQFHAIYSLEDPPVVDGVLYDFDSVNYVATVGTYQCFHTTDLVIPHQVKWHGHDYTVTIKGTDFEMMACNNDIRTLTFAEGTKVIESNSSFYKTVQTLYLPSTLDTINGLGRYNLLDTVVCLAPIPPVNTFTSDAGHFYTSGTLFVPVASYKEYRSAPHWRDVPNIKVLAYEGEELFHQGVKYVLHLSSKTVTVLRDQFTLSMITIPAYVPVGPENYRVVLDDDFRLMENRATISSLTLGEGHTTLPELPGWSNLRGLHLPASITTISGAGLCNFSNLKSITCLAETPPAMDNHDSCAVYADATLAVRHWARTAYRAHADWGRFLHVHDAYVTNDTVTVDGFQYTLQPDEHKAKLISGQCFEVKKLVVPATIMLDGTTYDVSLGSTDFSTRDCNRDTIESIELEEGHAWLGSTHWSMNRLTELYLPSTMRQIDTDFSALIALKKLVCLAVDRPYIRLPKDYIPAFDSVHLYVPGEAYELYKYHTEWQKFRHIYPVDVEDTICVQDADAHLCYAQQFISYADLVLLRMSDSTMQTDVEIPTIFQYDYINMPVRNIQEGAAADVTLRSFTINHADTIFSRSLPTIQTLVLRDSVPPVAYLPLSVDPNMLDSCILRVPKHALQAYRADSVWGQFRNIRAEWRAGDTLSVDGLIYVICRMDSVPLVRLHSTQCLSDSILYIPPTITCLGDVFTVDPILADMFDLFCNRNTTAIVLGEAHTSFRVPRGLNMRVNQLSLPTTLTQIHDFRYIRSIRDVFCYAVEPPAVSDFASGTSGTLHVPIASIEDYRAHPKWQMFASIVPIDGDTVCFTDSLGVVTCYEADLDGTALRISLKQVLFDNDPVAMLNLPDSIPYKGQMYPLSSIQSSAFARISGFQYIEAPAHAPRCQANTFYGWNREAVLIIVPHDSCVADYRTDTEWNRFPNIVTRLAAGDTIRQNYYQTTPNYQLFFTVQPDRRHVHLVRRSGGYLVCPSKDVEVPADIHDDHAIPYSVTAIADSVLAGCADLTSLSLPASVQHIGQGVLAGCTKLRTLSVDSANPVYYSPNQTGGIVRRSDNMLLYAGINTRLSDTIKAIGAFAFQGLPISELYLPGSITTIGEQALAGCPLQKMHVAGMVPPSAAADAFLGVDTLIPVFVPRQAVETYQAQPVWQHFATITPWYEMGDTITRRYAAGAYTSEYTLRYLVIDEGRVELLPLTYRIEDGLPAGVLDLTDTLAYRFVVTQLADGALRNCQELYSLHLGSQVTYLGDSVFLGCKQLSWIICDALTPPAASIATFDGVDLNTRVDVPAGAFAQYKVADGWRLFYCFNPLIINDEQPEGLPAVPSGTDEQTASAKVVKCFYRGDVLILRDGRLYDLLGRPIGSTK